MGFVEGRDYIKQLSETAADGKRKRTDFIIKLPDDRQVIIDSKVSLKAWDRFVNAETEEEAENAMKAHCDSIAKHAENLASKRYQDMESVNSVEFVLMFVPLESAFGAAMRQSPELYMDLAGNVNVKVVTGATIVTALLLIKEMWKRELQSHNQIKLIEESGKLYDKIVGFLESFTQVGFELKQATSAYDTALNRLSGGQGNVIKKAENLKELGAKVTKHIEGNKDIKESNLLDNANYSHDNSVEE
jgi:DNA recombination protein RmuC